LFHQGFLPSSRSLDRFYLCRQVRVDLARFRPSSENRRILRKGVGIDTKVIPRAEFEYTPQRRDFCQAYADTKFGQGVMSQERLDSLFAGAITSHVILFTEAESGREIGTVTCYLEPKRLAFYYYAFYDLAYRERSLGMFMMTSTVSRFAEEGFRYLYLGSCYSHNALYKLQFDGAEFFNGVRWSANLQELKYLIGRDQESQTGHLLETDEYRLGYYGCESSQLAPFGTLSVPIRRMDQA
jgi:hypothetical protein